MLLFEEGNLRPRRPVCEYFSEYTGRGKSKIPPADRIPMNPSHKARKNPFDNADLGFLFLHTRRLVLYLFSFISMSHTLSDMTQF